MYKINLTAFVYYVTEIKKQNKAIPKRIRMDLRRVNLSSSQLKQLDSNNSNPPRKRATNERGLNRMAVLFLVPPSTRVNPISVFDRKCTKRWLHDDQSNRSLP